jgi:hypothetical protein
MRVEDLCAAQAGFGGSGNMLLRYQQRSNAHGEEHCNKDGERSTHCFSLPPAAAMRLVGIDGYQRSRCRQ